MEAFYQIEYIPPLFITQGHTYSLNFREKMLILEGFEGLFVFNDLFF
jgi:hypothetical protein